MTHGPDPESARQRGLFDRRKMIEAGRTWDGQPAAIDPHHETCAGDESGIASEARSRGTMLSITRRELARCFPTADCIEPTVTC